MENGFDFGALLRNNEMKHKKKPTQFVSVAGGVQKRLQSNIKNRKSTRLTAFDNTRNLERCQSPAPLPMSEAQLKMEHRKQQLEKWKAEKEQKKKQQAAQKKKPFLAGVPRNPLNFVLPPPLPKPSTSGRVTRSQTRSTISKQKTKSPVKPTPKGRNTQSFAPKNASFKPPEMKNLAKLPKLAPVSKNKTRNTMIIFDPIIPKAGKVPITAKQTRSRPTLSRQNATENKYSTRPKLTETRSTTRGKVTKKPSPKKGAKKPLTSSSSGSDIESAKVINRIKTPGPRKLLKEPKKFTPKILMMESTSSEKSSGESGDTTSRRSARKSVNSVKDSQSTDNMTSDIDPSSDEEITKVNTMNRRSVPKNFSLRNLTSDSSTDKISSDAELVQETLPLPVVLQRRSLPCTPKNRGVPKSESSSEEKLRSPKSPIERLLTPEQIESAKISPCVTLSRGKDNARREMKWKIDEGLLDDDVSDMDSVDHFRKQLSSEIKRMMEKCDTWDKILAQNVLPEAVQEAVLSAVGQARLLMSQKLQQFALLVERCAKPDPGAALVTPADLHGFWDMVFMQVENVDLRFKKLEELRARNWAEETPQATANAQARPARRPARARPAGAASSRIRDMIAAARRAKKEQGLSSSEGSSPFALAAPPAEGEKTFEAGFFCVRSPVRSSSSPAKPSPATPANKSSLLKAVLSSEAQKASASKISTPFAMLHASMIGKSVECDGFAPLPTPRMTPVNIFATPGRSILKSTVPYNGNKSGKKSIKVVLFDESDDSDPQYQSCVRGSGTSDVTVYENTLNVDNAEGDLIQDKENSPIIEVNISRTRSQRKSLQNLLNVEDTTMTKVKTPRRSFRKTKNAEEVTETEKKTPSKQSGRKKSKDVDASVDIVKEKRKRTTRKKAIKELESSALEETVATPKRSSRRNKAPVC